MNGYRMWYIHTMEYYSAMKNEILPFATTWMNLEDIMLGEINQTQKDKYYMISLICGIQESPNHRSRKWNGWLPSFEGWGKWKEVGQSTNFRVCKMKVVEIYSTALRLQSTILYCNFEIS